MGRLAKVLAAGQFVVVHLSSRYRALVAYRATVLVQEGLGPAEALVRISTARNLPVPDTEAQRTWLAAFAAVF